VQCTCGTAVVVASTAKAAAVSPAAPGQEVAAASRCPRCAAKLVVRDEDGTVVAACPSGHGLLVTHRALTELAAITADGPRALDAPSVACPRCGEPMTPRTFARGASIVVDVCDAHGTWFDAGELRAAAAIARESERAGGSESESESESLNRRAVATLDVALALEEARDESTARAAIAVADDLVDTFNVFVLGRTRTRFDRRYR
jgi:Zn-finger nucleic acid-binding protein